MRSEDVNSTPEFGGLSVAAASVAERHPKLRFLIEYLESLGSRADLDVLVRLLNQLQVTQRDLDGCCSFSDDAYRRNIICESPWYELVCLCWRSGQRTPIHDHEGSSCAFRVVEGAGIETRFDRTPSGLIAPADTHPLKLGAICAADDADIHQVANAQPAGTNLVTLHIYSPPLRNYRRYTLDSPTPERQCEMRPMQRTDPAAAGI